MSASEIVLYCGAGILFMVYIDWLDKWRITLDDVKIKIANLYSYSLIYVYTDKNVDDKMQYIDKV